MERICLITGSAESIMNVLEFIMEKIREKPDLSPKLTELEQKQTQERDKQVKILVPNSTAGMIIGKAGTYIKQIKEDSGSYVQISQKPKDVTLQERCITIIGEKENNKVACKMILQKIVEDPQSGSLPNVSYADVSGPVANYNPIGSPYAMTQQQAGMTVSSSTTSLNSAMSNAATGASLLMNGSTVNLSLNLATPNPNSSNITQPIVDHLKVRGGILNDHQAPPLNQFPVSIFKIVCIDDDASLWPPRDGNERGVGSFNVISQVRSDHLRALAFKRQSAGVLPELPGHERGPVDGSGHSGYDGG